jgi:RND family efflux transporter MFP subunit
MMRRLVLAVAGVLVAGAGFAAVTVAGADEVGRYRVAPVATGDVSQTVSVSGTVDHVNRFDASFGTDGTVATLPAVGATVTAGQELGTLDTASLQAAVDQASAALTNAESTLSAASAEVELPSDGLAEAQSAAAAALQTATDALAAQVTACADPASAACTEAASATLAAQNAVKTAQDTLQAELSSSSERAPSAGSVAEAQAAVDEASVKLLEAQQALAGATLTSPISGTVASVNAAVGDTTSAGEAVVVVIGEGAAEVSATAPVEQVDALAVGQQATVTPVGTASSLQGTVTRVGTLPDPNAETVAYPVTITVDKPPATMAAGTSATASIVVAKAEDVLTVPTSAVNRGTVTVLNGDQTTVTRVTVGAVGPTRTEIKEGLSAGDQVVLANLDSPLPTSDTSQGGGGSGPGPGGEMVRMRPGN